MKCKFCGVEIDDNILKCPACNRSLKKDKFPTWVIVLIVLVCSGFFTLPFIGIVAAITIPELIENTNIARNKVMLKKTLSALDQALLLEYVMKDKHYSNTDDVWFKAIKNNVNSTDIEGGIRLADLTEIRYEKLKNNCSETPKDSTKYGSSTACAKLTVDVDGFDKGKNSLSSKGAIKDRFVLWLYANRVEVNPNSVEYDVLTKKLSE